MGSAYSTPRKARNRLTTEATGVPTGKRTRATLGRPTAAIVLATTAWPFTAAAVADMAPSLVPAENLTMTSPSLN